mmetsp:Transcript_28819/g.52622  ORF Transcript_28819/g.52622 Transcript_28819/m.52622 type:complete len:84 (-) Transcript_28819:368-619(-)
MHVYATVMHAPKTYERTGKSSSKSSLCQFRAMLATIRSLQRQKNKYGILTVVLQMMVGQIFQRMKFTAIERTLARVLSENKGL